jgi:hypothetical protein
MSSSRSEFLKRVTARFQRHRSDRYLRYDRDLLWWRDIALREAEREEQSRETPLERIVEPGVERKRRREQVASGQIDTAAAPRAAQIEPEPNAGAGRAAAAQLPRQPSDMRAPIGLSADHGNDLSSYPAASWAEAGMPLRLRDAIASVRRISNELHPGAPRNQEAMPAPPLTGNGGDDEFLSDRDPPSGSWDEGSAGRDDGPAEGHGQVLADQIDSPTNETLFGNDPIGHDLLPTHDQLREFGTAFQHGQIALDDRASPEAPTLGNEPVLEGDARARMPRERLRPDDHERYEEPSPGLEEELHDRLPARRESTAGYGIHVTALAAAIVFVALAGFGFGMLSDSAVPERASPAQDTAPAPPSARLSPLPAAPQTQAPLDKPATVRVAPPPGDALPEPASRPPHTVARTKALPLPPPPKPDWPQAATHQAPSNSRLRDAVDAAATGPSLAEASVDPAASAPSEAEGMGGPFEPLFAKLPASRAPAGQVLVHYKANAAGGPATAMYLVRQLKAAGFSVEARPVQFPIAGNSIRYFFPGDRDQAEALRTSLEGQLPGGAALSVMDFSSLEPKPQEGHLEVWLRS